MNISLNGKSLENVFIYLDAQVAANHGTEIVVMQMVLEGSKVLRALRSALEGWEICGGGGEKTTN